MSQARHSYGFTSPVPWALHSHGGQWTLSVQFQGQRLIEGITVSTAQAVAITGGADIATVLAAAPPQLIIRPLTTQEMLGA